MKPELTATPRLAPGCRLNEKSQQPRMLLMPERALRLNGPSLEIVQLCDGRTPSSKSPKNFTRSTPKPNPSASPTTCSATSRSSTTSARSTFRSAAARRRFYNFMFSAVSTTRARSSVCHSERSLRREESLPDFRSYDQSRFL